MDSDRQRSREAGLGQRGAEGIPLVAQNLAVEDRSAEMQAFGRRVLVLFLVMLGLVGILVLRMLHLQVLQYEKYRTRSEENRMEMMPLPPARGLIFDRSGNRLAENRPVFNLVVVPERVDDIKQRLLELATVISLSAEEVEQFRQRSTGSRRPFGSVLLKASLDEEEIAALSVNRHRFAGVEVEARTSRHYPYGYLTGHAVGSVRRITQEDLQTLDRARYSGTNFIGKRGVEKFYERSLHGRVGNQWVETDAYGFRRKVLDFEPPAPGQNITLHLDVRVQIAAAAALGERRGAVIALDPRSGGVLALVSNPSYDPNEFVLGMAPQRYRELVNSRDKPLLNRAVSGLYAPGSTIKPILGLAALSYGAVDWDEEILDRGTFRLPGQARIYRDWNWKPGNPGGQGIVDLNRAIYRSSNIYFYNMGVRLQAAQMAGFLRQFGYGELTAADVEGASAGLVPDAVWKQGARGEPWYPGDSVNLSIGQGDLLVTPLQAAAAAAVFANRGRRVRPRLLLASDRPMLEADPLPALPPVTGPSADDWERMVDAMEDVVHRGNKGYGQNGTAWAYIGQGLGYRMAGKSGTAQVVEIKQGEAYEEAELDERNRKHAWFVAFAPADAPAIVVSVLVENGGGGSSVAGPVARDVLDAYLLPKLAAR